MNWTVPRLFPVQQCIFTNLTGMWRTLLVPYVLCVRVLMVGAGIVNRPRVRLRTSGWQSGISLFFSSRNLGFLSQFISQGKVGLVCPLWMVELAFDAISALFVWGKQKGTHTQVIGHLFWEPHSSLIQNNEKSSNMQYKNTAHCSSGVPLSELCANYILPYGQSCLFCSVGRGFLRRKLSRLGPWRPRGSSGGMNLDKKTDMTDCTFRLQYALWNEINRIRGSKMVNLTGSGWKTG